MDVIDRRRFSCFVFILSFFLLFLNKQKNQTTKIETLCCACWLPSQYSGLQMLTWRMPSAGLASKTWWRCDFMRIEPTGSRRASASSPSVPRSAPVNAWTNYPKRSFTDRRPSLPLLPNKHSTSLKRNQRADHQDNQVLHAVPALHRLAFHR